MKGKNRPSATCHPDKPHYVHGLCKACASRAEYNATMNDLAKREKRRLSKLSYNRTDGCRANRAAITYNISKHQALQLIRKENCEICDVKLLSLGHCNNSRHVDHCHSTGLIRGVLCSACNRALGLMQDDINRIRSAADYLCVASTQKAYA